MTPLAEMLGTKTHKRATVSGSNMSMPVAHFASLNHACACMLAVLLCVAGTASAQTPERVAVISPTCRDVAVWQHDLVELLRVELQVDRTSQLETGATTAIAQQLPALWVQRDCAAGSGAPLQLRASDPQRGTVLERTLTLHDVPPELQSRVIALALAELLRASWPSQVDVAVPPVPQEARVEPKAPLQPQAVELALKPADVSVADVDPGAAERLDLQPSAAEQIAIALGPALHVSLRGSPVLYGAELTLSWWQFSVGALGYLGSASDAIGDIALKRLHGFAVFEVLQLERGPWFWSAAVRGGAGGTYANARALGTALSTGSTDFSCDGSLEAGLALRFATAWALRLRASLGLAYSPAYRADNRVIADYSGLFAGISLSVARFQL